MTDGQVLQLGQQALWLMLLLAGPILGLGLAVGLVVSVLQAMTQINDQTLSFVPKLAAMLLALLFFGAWMLAQATDFAHRLLVGLPTWAGH